MIRPVPFETYPCDQIGADALAAQTYFKRKHDVVCVLDLETLERIVSESESLYRNGSEHPFETALEMNEPYRSDWERGCYVRAARAIIGRRIAYKQQTGGWQRKLPFTPR